MTYLLGQSIGRYHILEQLGVGGMATVYMAYDVHLEKNVAVKVIRAEKLVQDSESQALKRFQREVKALAKLTHPNIVPITDYGEYEGKPYLVMPYLPGGTLKEKLGKPIDWKTAVGWILPIARALAFAHEQDIVHRDVKPSNILVTQSGELMLSDFGIAKILEEEATTELTATGVGIGTPEYMAPEQGLGKADARSDIYALGVVLYQMVTGHIPFQADTPMAVMLKKHTEPLPRPTHFVHDLPAAVENILIKALERDPNNRYPTMASFVNALEKLTSTQSTSFVGQSQDTTTSTTTVLQEYPTPSNPEGSKRRWAPWMIGAGILFALCVAAVLVATFVVQPFFSRARINVIGTTTGSVAQTQTAVSVTGTPSRSEPTATSSAIKPQTSNPYSLAFASDRDGSFDIYLMDPDQNTWKKLDSPSGFNVAIWPSFCGNEVAAEMQDTQGVRAQWIYLIDPDSGAVTSWNTVGSPSALGVPRCSPDGQFLAYSANFDSKWMFKWTRFR